MFDCRYLVGESCDSVLHSQKPVRLPGSLHSIDEATPHRHRLAVRLSLGGEVRLTTRKGRGRKLALNCPSEAGLNPPEPALLFHSSDLAHDKLLISPLPDETVAPIGKGGMGGA